ncbi:MAG TPA: hypothetical protein VGC56_13100 [Allosphingosinicella sp.]|jgi:hypothetical protein
MARGKDLSDLRKLDAEVLAELIREGETRIAAQLAVATAADQRSMTWAGFLIAVATAAIGGGASLLISGKHLAFALVAIVFSGWIFAAAWMIVDAVRPKHYFFPGNIPENWLPENWLAYPKGPFDLKEARVEQATCLNNGIDDNAEAAETHANALKRSMDHALLAIAFAGVSILGLFIWSALANATQVQPVTWL